LGGKRMGPIIVACENLEYTVSVDTTIGKLKHSAHPFLKTFGLILYNYQLVVKQ